MYYSIAGHLNVVLAAHQIPFLLLYNETISKGVCEMANDAEVQLAVDQAMKDQKKQKRKKKLIIFGVILAVIVVIVVVANRPKDYNFDQPAARVTVDTVMTDFKTTPPTPAKNTRTR